jgi:hypothetical protein
MLKHLYAQRHVLAICMATLVMPSVARAECVMARAALIKEPSIELVFRGSVVGLNQISDFGVRVTFNVDQVWKGPVPKRFDLYVGGLDAETARFEFQRPYLVFAHRMSQTARQGVGLTERDPVAFTATSCNAVHADIRAFPNENTSKILRELGEGRPAK